MDETLIYFNPEKNTNDIHIRPGLDHFLTKMAEIYEIVIFTAAQKDYANWAINIFDKNNLISHRLFR